VPALNDLIAGHIQVLFADSPPVLPQIESGKVRALGVTTGKRIPTAPDIPAIAETVPSFDSAPWQMLSAPSGTPAPVIDILHKQMTAYVARYGPPSRRFDAAGRACEIRREGNRRLGSGGAEGRHRGDRMNMR
jgi:Tripartite tricarboxylate transporter family receptor